MKVSRCIGIGGVMTMQHDLSLWLGESCVGESVHHLPRTRQTVDFSLSTPYASAGDEDDQQECQNRVSITEFSGRPLSFDEAFVYAERIIRSMSPGNTFTSMELFSGLPVRFDRRKLAHVLTPLRVEGMIIAVGATKEFQESRNGGWATKWCRTRGGYE